MDCPVRYLDEIVDYLNDANLTFYDIPLRFNSAMINKGIELLCSQREGNIVYSVHAGYRISYVADQFDLTIEEVEEILRIVRNKLIMQYPCYCMISVKEAKQVFDMLQARAKIADEFHVEDLPETFVPLENLNLSVRCYNALRWGGVDTVEELVKHSDRELLRMRNFGKKLLKEVESKLDEIGLHLAEVSYK